VYWGGMGSGKQWDQADTKSYVTKGKGRKEVRKNEGRRGGGERSKMEQEREGMIPNARKLNLGRM